MKIEAINGLPREGFVEALGGVFEESPWVAERAWEHRPFDSPETLYDELVQEVEGATTEEQLALLRAHPDLGATSRMSTASVGEQAEAGLDRLTPEGFERLRELNLAYRTKFGFPFLFAVKGGSRRDILEALVRRLERTADEEFREALEQVYRIARFRLEGIVI